MAYENIRLRKNNFTVVDGYFWMVDEDTDSIVVKTDDGTVAFSYPLDTTINQSIVSSEYDGRNLWTMRSTGTNQLTIDRWYINNYVCKLRNSFDLVPSLSHKFSSQAFTVEHYHTTFSAPQTAGDAVLSITDASKVESGYTVTFGPNSSGQIEEISVSSATSNSISVNGTIKYSYNTGDPVCFYKRIWLFNNYNGTDSNTGALYNIDAYTGSVITKYSGGAYKDIKSCTFYGIPKYIFDRAVGPDVIDPRYNSICYVKGYTMIFLDPDNLSTSNGAMVMDNIKDDQATNIDIYDLAIDETNVYRLQSEATYYGNTASFADNTYNYQLSTLNPFITSISLHADPAILPANGVNPSEIVATVKDQFNLPIQGRTVYFTDDDPNGGVAPATDSTDAKGQAFTTYTAGTSARETKISATAQQT